MHRRHWLKLAATVPVLACSLPTPLLAADKKDDVEAMVTKGLEWLKKNQNADGSWSGQGNSYPSTMTGVAGIALMMEGSTGKEGKYSEQISKAVEWYLKKSQPNGLLGTPNNPTEGSRYIYGHGFGMLFLACAYGEEEDPAQRKKLETLLQKAVEFSGKAQTKNGGWGYVSSADGGGFDEGSTTITQLQGLRAARNAGIKVPKEIIDKSTQYLRDCTTSAGGVVYNFTGRNPAPGGERPAITAAAVACAFSSGNYNDKYAKMWLKYCKNSIWNNLRGGGHDDYQNYYFGQAMYVLGDDRYGEMFPDEKKDQWMTWTKFKETNHAHLRSSQSSDGSWNSGSWGAGPVFGTGTALTLLQLEKGILPFYHR
jgi:hypothetical protein